MCDKGVAMLCCFFLAKMETSIALARMFSCMKCKGTSDLKESGLLHLKQNKEKLRCLKILFVYAFRVSLKLQGCKSSGFLLFNTSENHF